jgi:hypothetical protein
MLLGNAIAGLYLIQALETGISVRELGNERSTKPFRSPGELELYEVGPIFTRQRAASYRLLAITFANRKGLNHVFS